MTLDLDKKSRENLFSTLLPILENFYAETKTNRVSSDWNIREVKEYARAINFETENHIEDVTHHVLKGLTNFAVHTPHPNYFGLFNPRSNFSSIVADLITATFNPQLAAWSHAPFANEIENFVIKEFGQKIGYSHICDGSFCTGGAEANLTALICALNNSFPDFNTSGVGGMDKQPTIYCSTESHHSIVKAARITGLGAQSVRSIPVDSSLRMDIESLQKQLATDLQKGYLPLMIIGTAGTTGSGAIDDLQKLSKIANENNSWFHVDAAYGGAIAISEKYKSYISGIELGDSMTIDLHKWFSIPMGASLFLTKNPTILHTSFSIKTRYMPVDGDPNQIVDPYVHSVQWSRRFMGLKIYMPLAIHGWEGYETTINKQLETGLQFKTMLQEKGWIIINDSALPVICFTRKELNSKEMSAIVDKINTSGKAWLSIYPIEGQDTARVCITNYLTGESELNELIDILEYYRVN